MSFKPIKNKFISTIIGTLAVYIGVAFILPLNNFSVYITSYIHLAQPYVTMHYGMFINLIFSFSNSFSHPLGGYIENYLGFKKTILLGFSILFIANLIFIFQQNIWLCYFLAIILGIGTGIGTSVLGKNVTFYSPKKKGMISGIMGLGILLITATFALIGEKIISYGGYTLKKDENFYPENIAKRTYIYFLVGEICIPIALILARIFIYEYKPEENQQEPEIEKKVTDEEKPKPVINTAQKERIELQNNYKKQNILQAIKTFRYLRIAAISFFINFSISFMINTGRTFGALIGIDGSALQFSMIFQAISLIIVGPLLGILVDKKGSLFILRIVAFSSIFPGILLCFFMDITWVFILSLSICTLNITGLMVSFGPFIMEIFGIQQSVILGGIINGFSKFADLITTIAAFIFSLKYIEVQELKIPYRIMYIISAICCSISAFLLLIETNEKFNYKNKLIEESLTKYEMKKIELNNNDSIKTDV